MRQWKSAPQNQIFPIQLKNIRCTATKEEEFSGTMKKTHKYFQCSYVHIYANVSPTASIQISFHIFLKAFALSISISLSLFPFNLAFFSGNRFEKRFFFGLLNLDEIVHLYETAQHYVFIKHKMNKKKSKWMPISFVFITWLNDLFICRMIIASHSNHYYYLILRPSVWFANLLHFNVHFLRCSLNRYFKWMQING